MQDSRFGRGLARRLLVAALALAAGVLVTPGDGRSQQPAAGPAPVAAPDDVASAEAIVDAVYDVISGPAGAPRDWSRMRSLFVPGARLIPAVPAEPGGPVQARMLSLDDWIAAAGPFFEDNPFFERQIHAVTERYGDIAHVWSTYVSLREPGGEPFARGINSFQLLWDGSRWWIVNIFWAQERPGMEIPERYLP